jgi:hypothetical protein
MQDRALRRPVGIGPAKKPTHFLADVRKSAYIKSGDEHAISKPCDFRRSEGLMNIELPRRGLDLNKEHLKAN